MNKITAVVLTKNEENNIKQCLKSISWCDEILVIDDNSQDNTVAFSKEQNAKVIKKQLKDFSSQRNFALKKAEYTWVLFIDADERVSKELKNEIKESINKENAVSGYYIKRKDKFLGMFLKYGELKNIKLLRLAQKDKGKWVNKVHEVWKIRGKTETLNNPIIHYPHSTISGFLNKINIYSKIRSEELLEKKTKPKLIQIIAFPTGKFIYNYFIKLGFLDGIRGFVFNMIMSLHSFLVRAKLYLK